MPITTVSGFFLYVAVTDERREEGRAKADRGGRTHRKGRLWIPVHQHKILGYVFGEALTTQVRNTPRRTARADG